LSNSWLPTADASSPIRFNASIVGLSLSMAETNVDAPMLSPAARNSVFGFCPRSWFTSPASCAAPPIGPFAPVAGDSSRPWKSLMPNNCSSTGPVRRPITFGLWSLARYGFGW
jgi:hypothetical protein